MTPPAVRVNTFVQKNDKPYYYIDCVSKIFIYSQSLFGSCRFRLLSHVNIFCRIIMVVYFLSLNGTLLGVAVLWSDKFISNLYYIEHLSCTVLSYCFCNRMFKFYNELNKFDTEVGCVPTYTRQSVQNLVQMCVTAAYYLTGFFPFIYGMMERVPLHYIILSVAYTVEVNYYGHLLNLLIPRLKLINHYVETSLSTGNSATSPPLKEYAKPVKNTEETPCDMRKMMDLYHIMVDAYNNLIDAIKWQLLIIIIVLFICSLSSSYSFALLVIRGEKDILSKAVTYLLLSWSTVAMIPLFSPCTFANTVHRQVRKLRELLASRLYENKLDKTGRSITRALLAFTETRDLSFRLLRMLDIDISLPFKFVGLIITYLIILLQFEKVINPT